MLERPVGRQFAEIVPRVFALFAIATAGTVLIAVKPLLGLAFVTLVSAASFHLLRESTEARTPVPVRIDNRR